MPGRMAIPLLLAAVIAAEMPEIGVSHGFGMIEETAAPTEAAVDEGIMPYPTEWAEDGTWIREVHIGGSGLALDAGGMLLNETAHPDSAVLAAQRLRPQTVFTQTEDPQVLVVHTYGSKCYVPAECSRMDAEFCCRTTDPRYNLNAVGEVMCRQLAAAGIGAAHVPSIYDVPSCIGAGERCRRETAAQLAAQSSVQLVVDVARKQMMTEDTAYAPVVRINGQEAAQVRIVCETGAEMPELEDALRLTCLLQSQLERDWPGLAMPARVIQAREDPVYCRLTVEIGSCANTPEQAEYAAALAGSSLARVLLELQP